MSILLEIKGGDCVMAFKIFSLNAKISATIFESIYIIVDLIVNNKSTNTLCRHLLDGWDWQGWHEKKSLNMSRWDHSFFPMFAFNSIELIKGCVENNYLKSSGKRGNKNEDKWL